MNENKCQQCGCDLLPNTDRCPCCGIRITGLQLLNSDRVYREGVNTIDDASDTDLLSKFYKESGAGRASKHWKIYFILLPTIFTVLILIGTLFVASTSSLLKDSPIFPMLILASAISTATLLSSCGYYDFLTLIMSQWLKKQNIDCKNEFKKYYMSIMNTRYTRGMDYQNKHRFIRAVYLNDVGITKIVLHFMIRFAIHTVFWTVLSWFIIVTTDNIWFYTYSSTMYGIRINLIDIVQRSLLDLIRNIATPICMVIFGVGKIIYEAVATRIFDKHFKEWAGKYMAQ